MGPGNPGGPGIPWSPRSPFSPVGPSRPYESRKICSFLQDFFCRYYRYHCQKWVVPCELQEYNGKPRELSGTQEKAGLCWYWNQTVICLKHPPVIVDVPFPRVAMKDCFPASKFCLWLCSLLEYMLEITPIASCCYCKSFILVILHRGKNSLHKPSWLLLGCRSCDRLKLGNWTLCPNWLGASSYPTALPKTWRATRAERCWGASMYSPVSLLVLALLYAPFLLQPQSGLALPLFQVVHPFLEVHEVQGGPFLLACLVVPKRNSLSKWDWQVREMLALQSDSLAQSLCCSFSNSNTSGRITNRKKKKKGKKKQVCPAIPTVP